MIVRYIPADPAGNLTAIVLSPVAPQARAAVAARLVLDDDRRAERLLEGRALSPKPRRILVLLGRFVLLPAPEEVGPRAGPLGDRLRPGLDHERGVRAP